MAQCPSCLKAELVFVIRAAELSRFGVAAIYDTNDAANLTHIDCPGCGAKFVRHGSGFTDERLIP